MMYVDHKSECRAGSFVQSTGQNSISQPYRGGASRSLDLHLVCYQRDGLTRTRRTAIHKCGRSVWVPWSIVQNLVPGDG